MRLRSTVTPYQANDRRGERDGRDCVLPRSDKCSQMKDVLGRIILIRLPYRTGQARQATLSMTTRTGILLQIGRAASDIVSLHTKCAYRTGIQAGLELTARTRTSSCSELLLRNLHVRYQ